MYYSEKGPYKRGYGGQNITFENSAIVVHATMEPSTYHPVLNISVLPQVCINIPHSSLCKKLFQLPTRALSSRLVYGLPDEKNIPEKNLKMY